MMIALLGIAAVAQASQPSATATLTVHTDRPGARISPLLYGAFFEEINHAGDGGIYAELIRNRGFEDGQAPEGWSLVTTGGGRGSLALDTAAPLNEATPRSLRLRVEEAGPGEVGAANEGFWGIAVRQGKPYRLSLFARRDEPFQGPLSARLEGKDGRVLAEARLAGLTEEWRRYEATLRPTATDPAARLVLGAAAPGTVWLDVVSLFPATWKGRPNGLRPDLARMVADLRPAFLRFPGGCFVEGERLADAFRWKRTMGPVETRPGHWNLWGYRSSDGLGYHEYLQWCEDLRAEPLFVANCGMAHRDVAPMAQLDEWIQDALDAVEYANGSVTSRWGAVRARNGHPRPFHLRTLEVGNENGWGATLPAYEERYARFYDAFKARYPEIRLIATTPVRSRPMDLLDDHYYNSPEWFAANAGRYDRADRNGPRIYVGEYAVTQRSGLGNLRAALGEAAFMTGMERNADVVVMSSYAPLFVNVHDRKWNPDAIVFDSARSYGTPSYYVQQLFARNRGDVVLPVELEDRAPPSPPPPGGIGLATWRTQAEFKDVRVTRGGETLFAEDFAAGAPRWRAVRGQWAVQDGAYRQTAVGEDLRAVAGDPGWTDYTLDVKARKLGGAEGFLLMFRARDDANWYWWNVGGWNNTQHAIERSEGGAKRIVGNPVSGRVETGRWYDLRVDVQGPRIRCYLDGQLVHDVEDRPPPALFTCASRADRGDLILKLVNVSAAARPVRVALAGAAGRPWEADAVVLAGEPEAENSLAEPRRVAPVSRSLGTVGATFEQTLPAHSVTILRLRTTGEQLPAARSIRRLSGENPFKRVPTGHGMVWNPIHGVFAE